jgi:hypothetical protein
VADPAALLPLAERAAREAEDGAYSQEVLGAALYRAGRFEEAVKQLGRAVEKDGKGGAAGAQLFLAMAHHRLKHAGEARTWLTRAAEQIDRTLKKAGDDSATDLPSWDERLRWDLLRREAATLLGPAPGGERPGPG